MKLLKFIFLSLLILMSSHAAFAAWDEIESNTFSIKGTQISETNESFYPFVELVYNTDYKNFGISFFDYSGERKSIPYGIFRLKSCNMDAIGAISGHYIKDSESSNQLNKIFVKCDSLTYFKVWNTTNNYSLYIFEKAGPLKEEN